MITKCEFDEKKDFQEVVPDLAISIEEAILTGAIKDTSTSTPYTKETNVDEVGTYIHEPIDIALAAYKLGEQMNATTPIASGAVEEENK